MKDKSHGAEPRAPALELLSDEQLLLLRADLQREMRRRGIAFSVGEIGEHLVIEHFRTTPGLPKLQKLPRGTKNVDALSRDGDRYSIKTVLNAKKTGTIYPDTDDKGKQLFEHLVIAQLNQDMTLRSIWLFSWCDFVRVRCWDKRMSAWYVGVSRTTAARGRIVYPPTAATTA